MLHEVLCALIGYPGGVIRETESGFELASREDVLTKAERHLIDETVKSGYYCKQLTRFVESVRHRHFSRGAPNSGTRAEVPGTPSTKCTGHYVYGMVTRIDEVLQAYCSRVVNLETLIISDPSLPLAHLCSTLEEDRRVLLILWREVQRMKADQLTGGPFLDFLWTTAASYVGTDNVYRTLWEMVSGAGQVFVNQMIAWLVYGRLVDPDGEFFIVPSRRPLAGTSDVPLEEMVFEDFTSEVDAAAAQREWQDTFSVNVEAIPRTLMTPEAARTVLFVGKAVRVLLRSGRWKDHPVREEEDSLRTCFDKKSPKYVVERSVESIRGSVAVQLRQLVVEEAELARHLAAIKGFFLLGYGSFFQTLLESARSLLLVYPSFHAESELTHGPWATALSEHEVAMEAAMPSARKTPSERHLVSNFSVRYVAQRFEFPNFSDAARQVKLVGMARLTRGQAELGLGQPSSASVPCAMLWLSTHQKVASGFDQSFSFQVHAPSSTMGTSEYGARFALCLQHHCAPTAQQAWHLSAQEPAPGTEGSEGKAQHCPVWTDLRECVALEVNYMVSSTKEAEGPTAKISFSVFVCSPPSASHTATSPLSRAGVRVEKVAVGSCSAAAPRGMVHQVSISYNENDHRLQVNTDGVCVCDAEVDIAAVLSLDIGCAYVGFCLMPLDHQHFGASERDARYSWRDRPVSILSWRHHVHGSSDVVTPSDVWFSSLELSFKVPWPLPLVITQGSLDQYTSMFRMLLAFRHAHLELQRVDLPQKRLHAWAFRAQLSYFVSQVIQYFHMDVIEVAHQRLLQVVHDSQDFSEMVPAHEEFLSTVVTRCFVDASDLHGALKAALRIVHAFCRLDHGGGSDSRSVHRQGVGTSTIPTSMEVQQLRMKFSSIVKAILQMMSKMHREGLHAYLARLLLRLDYNGYFSGECLT